MRPAACRSAITGAGVPASAMYTRTSSVVSRLPVSWICHDASGCGCGRASDLVCKMSPSVPLHAVTVIARTSAVELRIETPSPFLGDRGQDSNGKTRLSTPAAPRRDLDQIPPLRGHLGRQHRVGTPRHDLGRPCAPAAFAGGAATAQRERLERVE